MKNPISRYAVIVLSCLLFAGSIAQAGPHHPKHKLEMMDKKLDLTDAQEKAVGAILEANHPSIMQAKKEIKGYKKQIHALLKADSIDEDQVRSLNAQAADKKTDLMILKANTHRLIQEQLTPEQIAKMDKWHEKKKKHGKRKHAHYDK